MLISKVWESTLYYQVPGIPLQYTG
jgi:hypothetical protein